ncbi:MAG: hypothetical protein GXZ08_00910 [Tissierellia bacterium]|nr:hypothetical protein [Tissierellia bacterium]
MRNAKKTGIFLCFLLLLSFVNVFAQEEVKAYTSWEEVPEILSEGDYDFSKLPINANKDVTIDNSTVKIISNPDKVFQGITFKIKNNGKLSLQDVNIKNSNRTCVISEDNANNELSILERVNLESTGSGAGIAVNHGNKLSITGEGSNLSVNTSGNGSSIGGEANQTIGDLIISGKLNVVAKNTSNAAGIGHGYDNLGLDTNNGSITIKDGVSIEASSKNGAGIGSSLEGRNDIGIERLDDKLEINSIDATIKVSSENGAGIGSGEYSKFSTKIYLENSKVEAESLYGAGIGSGDSNTAFIIPSGMKKQVSYSGDIIIDGGTVTAQSKYGSGIGMGARFGNSKHSRKEDERGTLKIINNADVKAFSAANGDDSFERDSSAYIYTMREAISSVLQEGSMPTMASKTFRPNTVKHINVSIKDPIYVDEYTIDFKNIKISVLDDNKKEVTNIKLPDGYRSYAYTIPNGKENGLYSEKVTLDAGEGNSTYSVKQYEIWRFQEIVIDIRTGGRSEGSPGGSIKPPNPIRHSLDMLKFKAVTKDEGLKIPIGENKYIWPMGVSFLVETDETFVGLEETCTVAYDANTPEGTTIKGTAPTDNTEYKKDSTVTVKGNEGNLYAAGYEFAGWNTKADGSGISYKPEETFTINGNITLYAKWNKLDEEKPEEEDKEKDYNMDFLVWGWNDEVPEKTYLHRAYINGYPDGSVRPQGEITRGEVAAIMSRLHADVEEINYGIETDYSDVNATDWYAKHISYVSDKGLMEGYEDGTFRPEEKITRAEYATVVARFQKLEQVETSFEDSKDHWASGYIGAVYNNGWITGYPDGTFKPTANISREEVATMTNKMLDRRVDAEGLGNLDINKFVDLEFGTWSYYEIVEASNTHEYVRRNEYEIVENWKKIVK